MEDVVENTTKRVGRSTASKDQKPKATKWTCSKAGTKLSDVQKASREKRGFQGSRRGQSPGDAFGLDPGDCSFP
jgi:hypothetical protein